MGSEHAIIQDALEALQKGGWTSKWLSHSQQTPAPPHRVLNVSLSALQGTSRDLEATLHFRGKGLGALYPHPNVSMVLPPGKGREAPEPPKGADNCGQLWVGPRFWGKSYLTCG